MSEMVGSTATQQEQVYLTIPDFEKRIDQSTDFENQELTFDIDMECNIEFEKMVFLTKKEELMKDSTLHGKYIAFLNGQVVDDDVNEKSLLDRVYKKYGYVSVLIEKLGEELEFTNSPNFETN